MKVTKNVLFSSALMTGALLVLPMSASADLGQETYAANCAMCHDSGLADAPVLGDAAAWASRLEAGTDALVASVIDGKGGMPPQGHVGEDAVKASVQYMIDQAK
ncbi:cytochrome c5 family protein [Halomonas sp. DQ26W]|uniref:c-type cytochrome n=1 Tax=Halomonas sp. DQ26W TaxID=2282311 RepID=UPI0021632F56|nr:c-type cytochrome [Halomonas sp. DQ26W]